MYRDKIGFLARAYEHFQLMCKLAKENEYHDS
jgi:hypothetical protein